MNLFVTKFRDSITGILKTFDRMLFRGTLLNLVTVEGLRCYLNVLGIPRSRWGDHLKAMGDQVETRALATAKLLGVDTPFVGSSDIRKEDLVREIARKKGITQGPIVLLRAKETGKSYRVVHNKTADRVFLADIRNPHLHLYFYGINPTFGLMHVRLQTWFPFNIQVCMNGHEYLACEMQKAGVEYVKQDNRFTHIADFDKAQELADGLLKLQWEKELTAFSEAVNPALPEVLGRFRSSYYWSLLQSEYSTDIQFRSPEKLNEIYEPLLHHAITGLGCPDVLRFLGKKPHGNLQAPVQVSFKDRPEGIRIRHSLGFNSVKGYNGAPGHFRIETTINDTSAFKVFRHKQGDPEGEKAWRGMRQGVADIAARAKVSEACNERYLDALAGADTTTPLGQLVETVVTPIRWKGKRMRGLRPFDAQDLKLVEEVLRGEYTGIGFRNSDLRKGLFKGEASTPEERRRRSAKVTYLIRLLRAHGAVRKTPRIHRYRVTPTGRASLTAMLRVQGVTLQALDEAVA